MRGCAGFGWHIHFYYPKVADKTAFIGVFSCIKHLCCDTKTMSTGSANSNWQTLFII